ncbi:restriction endonuclease subunit S [Edwardsiella tarda]|uniref:restriction endonuclease subunit S n=1 Tax=Edwardsiella tarda TaxID=636 RepID=UPI0015929B96|nr:restriction endonuclease subunit S [Edwardsiella tarda]
MGSKNAYFSSCNSWDVVFLKDISLKIGSGSTPRGGESAYISERTNFAFIRSQNVYDFTFDVTGLRFISDEDANKLKGVHLQKDDVLLNITGDGVTFSRCCLVPEEILPAAVNQHVAIIRLDTTKCLPGYLMAYLCLPETKAYIESFNAGGSRRAITKGHIESFEIPLPPMIIQEHISRVTLGLLAKQHINIQINQTLEQMAQALFKSWFVDFDPVVDNALDAGFFAQNSDLPEVLLRRAEQRNAVRQRPDFTPLPAETRQLFPAAFEACDEPSLGLGGWVPQGWSGRSISKAITVNPKVKLTKGEMAAFVDMKSLPVTGYSIEDVDRKAFSGGAKFKQHDVLFARITPCLQNGKTGFVDFLSDGESGFGSTEFIVLRGNEFVDCTYVACLARDEKFRQHAMQSMVGSSGRQRVQNSCFDDYFIVIPSQNIMNKFSGIVSTSFKKLKTNSDEIISLANIRDTLLPKLISGELRLKDNDPAVGADNND